MLNGVLCICAAAAWCVVSAEQPVSQRATTTKPTRQELVNLAGTIDTREDKGIRRLYCVGRGLVGRSAVVRFSVAFRAPADLAVALWDDRDGTPLLRMVPGEALLYDVPKREIVYVATLFPSFDFDRLDKTKGDYSFRPSFGPLPHASFVRLGFRALLEGDNGVARDLADGTFAVSVIRDNITVEALIDPRQAFPCRSITVAGRPDGTLLMSIDHIFVNQEIDDDEFAFPKLSEIAATQLPERMVYTDPSKPPDGAFVNAYFRTLIAPVLRVKPSDRESLRQAGQKWGIDEAGWNETVEADKRIAPSLRALLPKMPATQPASHKSDPAPHER